MNLLLLLSALHVAVAFYGQDPNIYELTPQNFDRVVYGSNYTTIVEFYAPWCGYCKQIRPVFQKLGRYIQGQTHYAVQVAAVDCDVATNKPLCNQHRIQGFPTLKVFRPPKFQRGQISRNKHVPEVYNGQRVLGPMVEYLSGRIKNYVKKFHGISNSLGEWLHAADGTKKAVIISNSNNILPLARSLAIDFLDSMSLASVSFKNGVSSFEVDGETVEVPVSSDDSLPLLLAYDSDKKSFSKYSGSNKNMKKMQKFLMKTLDIVPSEGPYSKREKTLKKYRGSAAKDEL